MDLVLFVAALAVILLGAELFTNGIEWFGHRLNLGDGAIGSVFAGVATALPETLIPVIAILGPILIGGVPSETSSEVGVGAILGAPFMLATLGMFVAGSAVLLTARGGRRGTTVDVDVRVMTQDVVFFLVAYSIAIGSAFLPEEWRWTDVLVVLTLVTMYAVYVRAHLSHPASGNASSPERLHATRVPGVGAHPAAIHLPHMTPRMWLILVQTAIALACIVLGARVFVTALQHISFEIGFDPRLFALIVAPVATELPETFNSVLWIRGRKDTLAMGNITGAMVFQSCIPTCIGILFTSWAFTADSALSFASAGAAVLATLLFMVPLFRGHRLPALALLIGGPIYVGYLLLVVLRPFGA